MADEATSDAFTALLAAIEAKSGVKPALERLAEELGQNAPEHRDAADVESGSLRRSIAMSFETNPLTIRRIWVIPWEEDRGLFGVAYEFTDGGSACDPVGSKFEAQAIVDEVERQRAKAVGENVIDLATAAGQRPRG